MRLVTRNKPIVDFFSGISEPNCELHINGYTNNSGVTNIYIITYNFDIETIIKSKLELLDLYTPVDEAFSKALDRLRSSLKEESEKRDLYYKRLGKNIKVHLPTETLHVEGLLVKKIPLVKSETKTKLQPLDCHIAHLRKQNNIPYFVQFALREDNFKNVLYKNQVLIPADL